MLLVIGLETISWMSFLRSRTDLIFPKKLENLLTLEMSDSIWFCYGTVCGKLTLHFCRSESVERDGTAFFAQQGLDEDYGTGEGQGVSQHFKI